MTSAIGRLTEIVIKGSDAGKPRRLDQAHDVVRLVPEGNEALV